MRKKKVFFTECAYAAGIVILALGTAFMERADFGMSMVVAPAYLLHLKISEIIPAYTFGMSEYVMQAVLLVVLSLFMGRFKKGYLFSFVTAVIYGLVLDLVIRLTGLLPLGGTLGRFVYYAVGLVLCSVGVSFLFHTYFAPEAYELAVKEIAERYSLRIDRVKTVYDCCSCAVAVILSFAFFGFGHFKGVKLGTVFCALVNGWLIGKISGALESAFEFKDGLSLREYFTK